MKSDTILKFPNHTKKRVKKGVSSPEHINRSQEDFS